MRRLPSVPFVFSRLLTMLSMVFVFCAIAAITSPAQTFTTLVSFGGANGNGPVAALIQGVDGNLYGTTINGGTGMGSDQCLPPYGGCGTVFKVTPSGTVTALYSFCSQPNCSDGSYPRAALVRGADGNYYGTTQNGGASCQYQSGCGTVFKVTPAGALSTLYRFCSQGNCPDGFGPEAGLLLASDGNFYGTTQGGGAHFYGTVFKITPSGTLTTLYNFCSLARCADGSQPIGGLIQAADGNLYGTTWVGGTLGIGTVFRITLNGVLTTLYSFNGHYGGGPTAALVQTSDGNFYGTTQAGGGDYCSPDGCGTVFKITPSGALTTLHSFSGSDGGLAIAGLLQATDGNFYGTTWNGGANGLGTVFKITMGGTLTTLHDFTGDGGAQEGTLLQATDGTVYGTAGEGGTSNAGTVFTLTLPLQFVPVTPCRLVDTRPEHGGGGPIPGGTLQNFPIQQEGNCNIPPSAAAYSLNVSVVPQGPLSYLAVWPAGQPQPLVSTLNSLDGRIKANAAIVLAGTSGDVSVFVTDTTNVILDIDGYFAPASGSTLAFYPLTPCRVADTRYSSYPEGLGPPSLTGGQPRDFPILNATTTCNIPASGVAAYSLNLTVVPHGPLGYLTAWPTGQPQPTVSTLNDVLGRVIANAAIVAAGTRGQVAVYPTNDTDLIIDINGYFAPAGPGGLSLYPVTPCRVIDTRQLGPPFSGALSPPVDVVDSQCAPPATAQAYVFNASVVPQGGLGYLTLWPDSATQPLVSTLNARDGTISSNMAIVPTTNGSVDAFASGITQLILDLSGYFAP